MAPPTSPTSPTNRQHGDSAPPAAGAGASSPASDATIDSSAESSRKFRPGRRPGLVWEFFTNVRTNTNKTHAVCNFCARQCAGVASRMAQHIVKKCPSASAHAIESLGVIAPQEPPEKRQRVGVSGFNGGSDSTRTTARTSLRSPPPGDAALQHLLVAFLRTKTPLRIVEDEYFRHALTLLAPSEEVKKNMTASELVHSVQGAVVQEMDVWIREATVFTLVHRAVACEWRGVDEHRRQVMIAEDSNEVERFLHSHTGKCHGVLAICCDTEQAYERIVAVAETHGGGLVSQCLLAASLRVWTTLVDKVPEVEPVIQQAAILVQRVDVGSHHELFRGWSLPFAVMKVADTIKNSDAEEESASSFWGVTAINWVLAPMAWLLVLCESKDVRASDVLLAWVWLLTRVESSPFIGDLTRRSAVSHALLHVMGDVVEDHHIAAFLLDPRMVGAGLSVSGKRKAKSVVIQVAAKLFPSYATETASRQALLAQLVHYVDRTSYFGDVVAWEMARSSSPISFWKDFASDAPELFKVATAVLSFSPTASITSEYISDIAAEPFELRQIQFHFERNQKHSEFHMEAAMAKYASLFSDSVGIAATEVESPSSVVLASELAAQLLNLRARGAPAATPDREVQPDLTLARQHIVDASWFAFTADSERARVESAAQSLISASLAAIRSPIASSAPRSEPLAV